MKKKVQPFHFWIKLTRTPVLLSTITSLVIQYTPLTLTNPSGTYGISCACELVMPRCLPSLYITH